MMCDYDIIQNLFKDLIRQSEAIFSKDEIREVSEFVEVGEYGLALETYRDLAIEESKTLSVSAFAVLIDLAEKMKLTNFVGVRLCEPLQTAD